MPESEALDLLEKRRPFADSAERQAAKAIVKTLGGFTIAVELVAAYLAAHPDTTCAQLAAGFGLDDLDTFAEDKNARLRRHNNERRLGAVLGPVIAGLSAPERRTLEYAALLHPDYVALPWLRQLVAADFPEIAQPGRLADPWAECWRKLLRLALFSRAAGEDARPRIVRLHRLVGELRRREMGDDALAARQEAVGRLITERDAALEKTTTWQEAAWELEPFDALARHWDKSRHPRAAWLLNQTGTRWHGLAQYTRAEPLMKRVVEIFEVSLGANHPNVATALNNLAALLQATNRLGEAEPLMRRALEIDEVSFGPNHPNVAIRLNNLAQLLQATKRLGEAEPLSRRHLEIFLSFTRSTGHEHPHLRAAIGNYARLLQAMGMSEEEVVRRLRGLIARAGVGLGR